jgi:hypothetical protein
LIFDNLKSKSLKLDGSNADVYLAHMAVRLLNRLPEFACQASRPFFSVTSVTSCSNPDHRWTIDEIRRAEREAKDV